jgi:hypothetical protein
MKNKYFFFISLTFVVIVSSCSENDNPTSSDKPIRTVRYFAFITPVPNPAVSEIFTYTNENSGTSQSGTNTSDGTFSKTIQLNSGTFAELTASGSTTQEEIWLGGRVIIYVDGNNIAESNASHKKYSISVSVSVIIP